MYIGIDLKKSRDKKRLSQEEVAFMLDISQKTLSNIESNKSKPTLLQLSKLGEIYEIDLIELLSKNGIVFRQKNKEGINKGIVDIHYIDKLIGQYEKRITDKDEIIQLLKEKIKNLQTIIQMSKFK